MHCLIIEDHPLVRSSIVALIQSHFEKYECTECSSAEEALRSLVLTCPDVVLIDLSLPQMNGFEAIKIIRKLHSSLPILVLSASDNMHDIQRTLDSGANGFINKTQSGESILTAIHRVLDGKTSVPQIYQDQFTEISDQLKRISEISPRQREVLKLMQSGLRNKEVANIMGISEATIKVHCRDIFKLLGVNNRQQAILQAEKLGLFS